MKGALGMRRFVGIAVAAFALASASTAQVATYDGHRVVRVDVRDEQQLDFLLSMTDDVWSENAGIGPLDVRVRPEQYELLLNSKLPHTVEIEDVQVLIDAEKLAGGIAGPGPFDNYLDLAGVNAYLNTLVALRPDLAQIVIVGTSLEGRLMTAIRITSPGGGTKPGIFYHGGQHAREWITVPTVLYLADQLIRNYDTDPVAHELVDRAEWFLLPVMNPDGYVYTWGPDRLWRKNRRNNGGGSFGVDLNRNWGYQWGGEGASTDPTDETYRGTAGFSEPETQAMRNFTLAHPNIVAHSDIHSYSQLILWPWGYTAALPPDQAAFSLVGTTQKQIIASVHGKTYTEGPTYTTIYPASGVSTDWMYGAAGVLSISFELRPAAANPGFLLPADQIRPTCEEMYPALIYQADYATAPVRISFPNGVPAIIAPNTPTPIVVRVAAARQAVNPSSVSVSYRTTGSGAFATLSATPLSGDDYQVILPARGCGAPTEIYASAAGVSGGVSNSPLGAPQAVYSIPVGTLTTLFTDDFESNLNWTVQNVSLTGGGWTRVNPNGTTQGGSAAQPEDDHTPGAGTNCYVTGQGTAGGAVGSADVDGGPTILTSPLLALSGTDPTIRYYRWFFNDDNASASDSDEMIVSVTNNDGMAWTQVELVTHEPSWTEVSFRLSDFVTPTNLVRIRFSVSDNPNNSVTEAAIDDVTVQTLTCAGGLPGDLNCDGSVNNFDIDPFILALTDAVAYQAAYPACNRNNADCNSDGEVNNFDIDAFVALLL